MKNLFDALNDFRGKDICGIYLLVINNKHYVGSSYNIKKRLRRHRTLLRNNKHDNHHLQNLYNKYKTCEYEVLEILPTTINNRDLRSKEKLWIDVTNDCVNTGDPVLGIGGTIEKVVYQYTKAGVFIKKWPSVMIAARELGVNFAPLHSCANPNVKQSKSAYGYVWSYTETIQKYQCNTGNNLKKVSVYLYTLAGDYHKSFKSLSDCAKYIAQCTNYKGDWKIIRTCIGYALQKPETRTVRKLFKVSYKKALSFQHSLSMGS